MVTGLQATIAILGALAYGSIAGVGQHLDMALLDSVVSLMSVPYLNFLVTGTPLKCMGDINPTIVPYQVFPCKDGEIVLAIGNDHQFRKTLRTREMPAAGG